MQCFVHVQVSVIFYVLASHPTYIYIYIYIIYMYVFHFTQDGATPLLMASQKGNLDVVEILLAAGAKVDLAGDVSLDSLEHTCIL